MSKEHRIGPLLLIMVGFFSLELNSCGNGVAIAIAKNLEINTTLQFISLQNNQIQDLGAEALGGVLAVNHSVKQIGM